MRRVASAEFALLVTAGQLVGGVTVVVAIGIARPAQGDIAEPGV